MTPHVPTMLLMLVVASAAMAASVVVVSWGRDDDGLRPWAAGTFLVPLAFILIALRDQIPDFFSIIVANVLLCSVFSLLLQAVCQFQGRRASGWLTIAPVVFYAAVTIFFTVFSPSIQARITAAGLMFAGQDALILAALLSRYRATVGRGRHLTVFGLAMTMLMLIYRAAITASGSVEITSILSQNHLQTASFFLWLAAVILTTFGFVFMTKERTDEINRVFAMQDALTGLANRRSLLDSLDRYVSHAERSEEPLCLLMIDLDFFKKVNDSLGHLAGDYVLVSVADIIRNRLRTQDLLGRYGGEEFLAVLPNTSLEGGCLVAEALRDSVARASIAYKEQGIPITISIGVHSATPGRKDSLAMLIGEADRALYRAKENGRNRVEACLPA